MTEPRAYILCTSPRSGSTLLCKMLTATGVAGKPKSYFHGPNHDEWRSDLGLDGSADLARIFVEAQHRGRAGTDLFGLRLQRHSFSAFTKALAVLHPDQADALARIEARFGPTRFIHLTRRDKVAQAVSFEIARQSGLWHRAPDGREIERLAPPAEPQFDETALRARIDEFRQFDAAWQDWFASHALQPMTLTYEDLAAAPHKGLARVLQFLDLDPTRAATVSLPVARLADARNADWCARLAQT